MYLLARVKKYERLVRIDRSDSGVVASASLTAFAITLGFVLHWFFTDKTVPIEFLYVLAASIPLSIVACLFLRRVVYLCEDRIVKGMDIGFGRLLLTRELRFAEIDGLSISFDENPPNLLQPKSYKVVIEPSRRMFSFKPRTRNEALEAADLIANRIPNELVDQDATLEIQRWKLKGRDLTDG